MAREIDIKLKTTYDGKGGEQAKKHLNGIADGFSKIGEALGGANSNLGRFMQNILKGGIWGAAAELVGYGIKKIHEWFTASERAEKEAAKVAKEAHAERMKCLDEYAAAIDKLAAKRTATINQNLKALNDELDATKELTKATLELEKAEARKRGDTGRMAELDREMEAVDMEAARIKLQNEIAAAKQRQQIGEKDLSDALSGQSRANNAVQQAEKLLADKMSAVVEQARSTARGWQQPVIMQSSAGAFMTYGGATESEKANAANKAVESFKKSQEYKDLAKQLEDAKKHAITFDEKVENAKNAIKESAKAEQNLLDRMTALNLKEEAKIKNQEAQASEEKKTAEEKRISDVKAAELKASAEAVKERERLDREAHQKRMNDIRAEITAFAGRGNILKATAATAQNEFDRAFAIYRDPTQAAAVINEEKDYQVDLKRLHRDASRYGGQWRIDELSRLMAAGDSQGVTDTLSSWRKSKRFTPEIEAMVRASAAEKTKTTAEDELRKIESNTADLARKLEELIAMKG